MEWSGRAGAKGFGAGSAVEDDANVTEALVASRGDGLKTVSKRGDTGADGERRRTGDSVQRSGGSQRFGTEGGYGIRRNRLAGRRADEKAPARCAGSFARFQPRGGEAASYRAVRPCANEAHDAEGGGALIVWRLGFDSDKDVVAPADLNACGDARAEDAGDSFELFDTSASVVAEEDGGGGAATRLASGHSGEDASGGSGAGRSADQRPIAAALQEDEVAASEGRTEPRGELDIEFREPGTEDTHDDHPRAIRTFVLES